MPFYPTCALQTEGTLTTNTSFPSNMRPTDPSTSFQRRGHRPKTIWVVWQEFWEQYSGANLLLPRDLGAWVAPTHRQWNWFYNSTTNTMSKWTETQSGVTNARPLAEWPPVQQTPTTAVDAILQALGSTDFHAPSQGGRTRSRCPSVPLARLLLQQCKCIPTASETVCIAGEENGCGSTSSSMPR
jgi:hypothetical protein